MSVEIAAVGGYGESGRNMTAIKIDDEVILLDMGLHLPNYIKLNNEAIDQWTKFDETKLKRAGAIPQDKTIKDWKKDVVAIVVTHAHLDHIGATPYLAPKYNVPIICSPFAASILTTILRDERISIPNKIVRLKGGKKIKISDKITIEFVHITHSTPQTVMVVLHTPYGLICYGNDYKLDDHPTLGKPVNRSYLKKLGTQGVLVLIQDCLYAHNPSKTPSEFVAKQRLKEVLLGTNLEGKGLIITTFSSHIARLKSIAEFGKLIGRKVIFVGRSIHKYSNAAKEAGVANLFKQAKIIKYSRQAKRTLKQIMGAKENYLLVVSGHQGEPQSALSKMLDGVHPWRFDRDDIVIFSSKVIPAQLNIDQRKIMDTKLRSHGVRIFDEIHVSGHSSREDLRDMLQMLEPSHVLPTHGDQDRMNAFNSLAQELGYKLDESLHPMHNADRLLLE